MRYKMLLWPHANARYQGETLKLARLELELMLERLAPGAQIAVDEGLAMPCLDIDLEGGMDAATIDILRGHSLLYGLFEDREGLLAPVAGRQPARVGQDLPAILKYKGKTNEMFCWSTRRCTPGISGSAGAKPWPCWTPCAAAPPACSWPQISAGMPSGRTWTGRT